MKRPTNPEIVGRTLYFPSTGISAWGLIRKVGESLCAQISLKPSSAKLPLPGIKAYKEEMVKKAMGQYYGKITETEKNPEEEDLPTLTLDDLENEAIREDIENIPAWKRMMGKK